MPSYTGDPGQYYPTLGLTPVPGEFYDIDDPGDGRWVTETPTKTKRAPAEAEEK